MTKWRRVPHLSVIYAVSDTGQIVRLTMSARNPEPFCTQLQPFNKHGYMAIHMQRQGHKQMHYMHRLVWEAFRGPIPSGFDVNHRDGDRANNRLDNLELATRSENMLHMFKYLKPSLNRVCGTAHHKAKLTPDDVKQILELSRLGNSQAAIGTIFGVSANAIRLILIGKNWKHVSGIKQA